MMAENVESFRESLIEKTKKGALDWKPLTVLKGWNNIEEELYNENIPVDFNVNSIRVSNSFYLQSGDGYIFLFEIYHGDPEVTSPEMDTIALMAKINKALPIDNLTYFVEEEQEQLRTLQVLVENYFEEKYAYPDVLYNFFSQVINGE